MRNKSNLDIYVNLMIDDDEHSQKNIYVPGDYVTKIFPELAHPNEIKFNLTPKQQEEYYKTVVCSICGQPCAGTCTLKSRKWHITNIFDSQLHIRISGDIESQLEHLLEYYTSSEFNLKNENDYVIAVALGIALYNTGNDVDLEESGKIFSELVNLPEIINGSKIYKEARRLATEYLKDIKYLKTKMKEK